MSISKTEFGPFTEEMVIAYCEESHRSMITNLDVDGKMSYKLFRYWYMDWLFGDESDP